MQFCRFFLLASAMAFAAPDFSLVGFATQNGGTTGGAGGDTVTVSTYADLKSHAESTTKEVLFVQGTITNGVGGGQIRVNSNKSILGLGSTAFLNGVGISIGNQNNVIVRNLKITLVGTTTPSTVNGGDLISIYGTSKNIWIDHCELYSEDPDIQTNKDKYDGLLDIKGQTGFITLSWNYLHHHWKGGLVGSADDDLYADRKVTMHHNYYNAVKLRVPMYRGSTGHFFNNYIVGAQDATEIRAGTCVRVEKNYYEALHYSIYTPADSKGSTERIDNVEVSRTSRAYPANCTASIPYTYSNVLTSTTNDVKTVVSQNAGVGKVTFGAGASSAALSSSSVAVSSSTISSSSVAVSSSVIVPPADCGGTACAEVQQGEDFCDVVGVFESKNTGFLGAGYVNPDNSIGSSVGYALQETTGDARTLYIRYANGGATSRNISISTGTQTLVADLPIPSTASWNIWNTLSVPLKLPVGRDSLILSSFTADGAPNIDWIGWSGKGLIALACDYVVGVNKRHGMVSQGTSMNMRNHVLSFGMTVPNNTVLIIRSISGEVIQEKLISSTDRIKLQDLAAKAFVVELRSGSIHLGRDIVINSKPY